MTKSQDFKVLDIDKLSKYGIIIVTARHNAQISNYVGEVDQGKVDLALQHESVEVARESGAFQRLLATSPYKLLSV